MSAGRPVEPDNPGQVEEPETAETTTDTLVIAGRYEIDMREPLGSGGMAVVYRGRDLRTRRPVAVRTLRTAYRGDPGARATFRQETRYQALANHGNIARIYDLHEEQDAPWAVMELVPGQTLRDLLTTHGPYPPADAADLLDQVASALAHLHLRKIVHLDVKPENLIIAPDGTVKLIDFGLAQPSDQPANLISGNAFGTAAYLSPEQIMGGPVGPATDIYALACVAYEVITGSPPFGGVPADAPNPAEARNTVLRAHLDTVAAPPSLVRPDLQIPAALDDIVLWALAKRPNERYSDVTAFARQFRGALEPLGTEAMTTPIAWDAPPPSAPDHRQAPDRSPSPPVDHMPYMPPRSASEARLRWSDAPSVATVRAPAAPAQAGTVLGSAGSFTGPQPQQAPAPPAQTWSAEPQPRAASRPFRRVRRLLVRLLIVATLANLLLFAVLVVTRGAAEVFPFQPSISRDAEVTITGGRTNVRSDASDEATILDTVADETVMTVTGNAERDGEGFLWWPVTGAGVEGWVREDRLVAEPDTWLERTSTTVSDAIDDTLDPIRDSFPDIPSLPGF
ncbi:MAG TPA: protein kinase [Thermomicrobiales bacterium]|nr:protein kinase [Thermomicrobiales bacterium]